MTKEKYNIQIESNLDNSLQGTVEKAFDAFFQKFPKYKGAFFAINPEIFVGDLNPELNIENFKPGSNKAIGGGCLAILSKPKQRIEIDHRVFDEKAIKNAYKGNKNSVFESVFFEELTHAFYDHTRFGTDYNYFNAGKNELLAGRGENLFTFKSLFFSPEYNLSGKNLAVPRITPGMYVELYTRMGKDNPFIMRHLMAEAVPAILEARNALESFCHDQVFIPPSFKNMSNLDKKFLEYRGFIGKDPETILQNSFPQTYMAVQRFEEKILLLGKGK